MQPQRARQRVRDPARGGVAPLPAVTAATSPSSSTPASCASGPISAARGPRVPGAGVGVRRVRARVVDVPDGYGSSLERRSERPAGDPGPARRGDRAAGGPADRHPTPESSAAAHACAVAARTWRPMTCQAARRDRRAERRVLVPRRPSRRRRRGRALHRGRRLLDPGRSQRRQGGDRRVMRAAHRGPRVSRHVRSGLRVELASPTQARATSMLTLWARTVRHRCRWRSLWPSPTSTTVRAPTTGRGGSSTVTAFRGESRRSCRSRRTTRGCRTRT